MNNEEIINLLTNAIKEHYDERVRNMPKADLNIYSGHWLFKEYDEILNWLTELSISLEPYKLKPTDYRIKDDKTNL